MALHTHRHKLIPYTTSEYEMLGQSKNERIFSLVKLNPEFTLQWDIAHGLCAVKELLCFVQERSDEYGGIAWEEIAEAKYEAVDSKDGENKAEDVDRAHE
jgi:hypothetical protein